MQDLRFNIIIKIFLGHAPDPLANSDHFEILISDPVKNFFPPNPYLKPWIRLCLISLLIFAVYMVYRQARNKAPATLIFNTLKPLSFLFKPRKVATSKSITVTVHHLIFIVTYLQR